MLFFKRFINPLKGFIKNLFIAEESLLMNLTHRSRDSTLLGSILVNDHIMQKFMSQ